MTRIILNATFILSVALSTVTADENRWWPEQAMPKGLVRTAKNDFPSPHLPYEMMAQSIAGLAAKADALPPACRDQNLHFRSGDNLSNPAASQC